jgi:HSP20 family protein
MQCNQPAVKTPAEETATEHTRSDASFVPTVDIVERGDALVMYLDMPGAKSDSIDVDFNGGCLSIYGKVEPRGNGAHYLLREYGVGDFFRSFQVSEDIDAAAITAEYRDGVLEVRMPKAEAIRPRKISVGSAN